uniref:Uncharacterized protein n=1 Tax=Periophthalmus magnuspinnatus TaxID=409849 RepID=A0A3B4A687_9GOBI
MPGILPTLRTTMRSRLFPVRTLTALLMVMLSMLTPFTSTSLSPTVSPACAGETKHTLVTVKCRVRKSPPPTCRCLHCPSVTLKSL